MITNISLEIDVIIIEQGIVDTVLIIIVVHITTFGYIVITKNSISYNSSIYYKNLADYISFIIKKIAVKAIIVFVAMRVTVWDKSLGILFHWFIE